MKEGEILDEREFLLVVVASTSSVFSVEAVETLALAIYVSSYLLLHYQCEFCNTVDQGGDAPAGLQQYQDQGAKPEKNKLDPQSLMNK